MKTSLLCGFSLVLVACSSGGTSVTPSEVGGAPNGGVATALGGTSAASPASGGATTATTSAPGGAANETGGATNSPGGGTSIGGTSTALGAGGSLATGGALAVGGNVGTGGFLGLGGALATGGAPTGGITSTGGTRPSTGGVTAIGGTPTTTGGTSATGGAATGGVATGGNATGGAVTGGAATGGVATGGNATGGAATGGVATGGNATGGFATGGNATGGATCAPSTSNIQFVDPTAGTDDDQHGTAFGACAYKTLTYALTRASGPIALQSGTYTSDTETFPIVLTGSQQLLCQYTTAARAVIQGKGYDSSGKISTVVFNGSQNALKNCNINGNGTTGYCVHVIRSGSFSSSPHLIDSSDIGYCGTTGITVRYADNVAVKNSSIHNSQIGISWQGPNAGGSMLNNSFKANSIRDIECSVADPGVTGSGNTATGSLYCNVCGNCPFK